MEIDTPADWAPLRDTASFGAALSDARRRAGLDQRELADPTRGLFQSMLFSKIVPNCKKLGLLDRNDQWLRRRFEEMNVIQFEDWADTGEEYTAFALDSSGEVDAPAPVAGE